MNGSVDLQQSLRDFDSRSFDRGASRLKEAAWMIVSALVFRSSFLPLSGLKRVLLQRFGASVGRGTVIKPSVQIKFPWRLNVGNDSWIGEGVWIDNLGPVRIGSNVCLSQGAMLMTGNHDYRSRAFDLLVGSIEVDDGAWIGARSLVCPGVKVGSGAVLAAGSTATTDLEPDGVYQGNPATWKRHRWAPR